MMSFDLDHPEHGGTGYMGRVRPRLADVRYGLYLAEDDMNVGLYIAGCPGGMDGIHIATSQDEMNLCDSAVSIA